MKLDIDGLTDEEVSAMSGRIVAPGVPPKSKKEAKEHLTLIQQLQHQERERQEIEARDTRRAREEHEKALYQWEHEIIPNWGTEHESKSTKKVWAALGIPAEVRSRVWRLAIGNPHEISSRMFEMCQKKAVDREHQGRLRPSVVEEAERLRAQRDEDPTFFSPKTSKLESASNIAVDLPRTIIARVPSAQHRRISVNAVETTSSRSNSPKSSPSGSPRDAASGTSSPIVADPQSLAHSHLLISSMCDDALLKKVNMTLRTFVEFRPDVGYVQGMSYLAAMLLMHLKEEEAFIALATLLTRGHFRYFYTVHHQGMSAHICVFEEVFEMALPEVHKSFKVIGVNPQMYVIDWWMSMFSRTLPFDIAVRCWDLYLLDEAYLYLVSLTVLMYFSAYFHEDSALDEVMSFLSRVQKNYIDDRKFFCLLRTNSPSVERVREVMDRHLNTITADPVMDEL